MRKYTYGNEDVHTLLFMNITCTQTQNSAWFQYKGTETNHYLDQILHTTFPKI